MLPFPQMQFFFSINTCLILKKKVIKAISRRNKEKIGKDSKLSKPQLSETWKPEVLSKWRWKNYLTPDGNPQSMASDCTTSLHLTVSPVS